MKNTPDSPHNAAGKRTILAIDDDPSVASLLSAILGRRGYRIIAALDGRQGLAKAIEIKPHFITLDIMMPGMDGWTVLKELKRINELKDIPVVILSVFDEKKLGYKLGAFDYLVKPFAMEDLFSVVEKVETAMDAGEDGEDI
ncbi:MAG: response regulator transcription factor [Candidatus Glassbacteria bacterium]